LESAGLTVDSVFAKVLANDITSVEKIDYLTAVAEGRRNAVLREIDRHRATLSLTLRDTLRNAEEDARVASIASPKALSKNAA
jgi:hypothetical protein